MLHRVFAISLFFPGGICGVPLPETGLQVQSNWSGCTGVLQSLEEATGIGQKRPPTVVTRSEVQEL